MYLCLILIQTVKNAFAAVEKCRKAHRLVSFRVGECLLLYFCRLGKCAFIHDTFIRIISYDCHLFNDWLCLTLLYSHGIVRVSRWSRTYIIRYLWNFRKFICICLILYEILDLLVSWYILTVISFSTMYI